MRFFLFLSNLSLLFLLKQLKLIIVDISIIRRRARSHAAKIRSETEKTEKHRWVDLDTRAERNVYDDDADVAATSAIDDAALPPPNDGELNVLPTTTSATTTTTTTTTATTMTATATTNAAPLSLFTTLVGANSNTTIDYGFD